MEVYDKLTERIDGNTKEQIHNDYKQTDAYIGSSFNPAVIHYKDEKVINGGKFGNLDGYDPLNDNLRVL